MPLLWFWLLPLFVSANSVYESDWHLQANADAVNAMTARLTRLRVVNANDSAMAMASVRFLNGALCVATQKTNVEIVASTPPPTGSVAMRLRLRDLDVYELFLIGGPWSLNIFRFRYGVDNEPGKVGVFPPSFRNAVGFHGQLANSTNWVMPLNRENITLPSSQELLWVVFSWRPRQTSAVWWNLDGKFNSNTSTALLHSSPSGSGFDLSNVTLYLRFNTTVCIEALVISDTVTDPQRALNDLEEKTGNRAVGTSLSMASTPTLKTTVATALRAPRAGLDGGTLGAIIGGCIAAVVLIGGVVAFVVFRRRKQNLAAHTPQTQTSEYGPITLDPNPNAKGDYGSSLANLQ
jgi:hypothetical protein